MPVCCRVIVMPITPVRIRFMANSCLPGGCITIYIWLLPFEIFPVVSLLLYNHIFLFVADSCIRCCCIPVYCRYAWLFQSCKFLVVAHPGVLSFYTVHVFLVVGCPCIPAVASWLLHTHKFFCCLAAAEPYIPGCCGVSWVAVGFPQ